MSTPRFLLTVLTLLGTLLAAQAQLQIKGGTFNSLNTTGAPVGSGPSVTTPQFAGQGATSSTAGAVSDASEVYDRYPSDKQESGGLVDRTKAVLLRASFGGVFASGVPRYALGDEIVAPGDDANTVVSQRQPAAPGYWRARPVEVGEGFTNPGSATPNILLDRPTVTVESSATSSVEVTVSGTHGVKPGATLLGREVLWVNGDTITLDKNADQTISSPTLVDYIPRASYYYSPHAERVFAHQPGQVTITWVTQAPVYGNGTTDTPVTTVVTDATDASPIVVTSASHGLATGDSVTIAGVGGNTAANGEFSVTVTGPDTFALDQSAGNGAYSSGGTVSALAKFVFRSEVFIVGSGTSRPVRKIYWTERSFNGPMVTISNESVKDVRAAYNDFFPKKVAEPYELGGDVPADPTASLPPERRTLWFDAEGGLGQLHAYNREGRIFVEYLGAERQSGSDVRTFLGADIVEVVQVATSTTVTVALGEQLQPHDPGGTVPGNADSLLPSDVFNLSPGRPNYYGTSARPDGRLVYHAERENDNPDRVVFYWLEEQDVAIHFLEEPAAPNLDIAWPKFLNKYLQVWPDSLDDFTGITVGEFGSTADTGVLFGGGRIPEVIYQDDGAQSEVEVDLNSQRLVADFSASTDRTNRTLLKFSDGSEVWYVRVFIQSADLLGSPGVPTLADRDADGVRDLIDTIVTVGSRLERPGPQYEPAGYIAAGTGYHPGAYLDPFVVGLEAAASGAIIPVNAVPGANTFQVWWFEKVEPPSDGFAAFYVPSTSGQYTVSWPATSQPTGPDQDQIILASNAGSGDLASWEAAGEIYVQNDSTSPGYNPNEEHALMLSGRAYALRDDLNVTSGAGYTSAPFVLISYTDPDDGRPAMRVFEVRREDPAMGHVFDYTVTAGSPIPAPMPLPLLPLPIQPDGTVRNLEVLGAVDGESLVSGAPNSYGLFTFQDRKGYTWVYRGPHDGSTTDDAPFNVEAFAGGGISGLDFTSQPGKIRYSASFAPFGSAVTPALYVEDGWSVTSPPPGGFTAERDFSIVAVDDGQDTSVVVGKTSSMAIVDGRPAIAYFGNNGHLYFAIESGSTWTSVVVDETGPHGDLETAPSLAVVDGRPAISYPFREGDVGLRYARAGNKDGSGTWSRSNVFSGDANDPGPESSLAVVGGRPAVTYKDPNDGSLKLARLEETGFQGTSAWIPRVIDADAVNDVGDHSHLIVVDGRPAVAYFDATQQRIRYKRATDSLGTSWPASPVELASNAEPGLSLAVVNGLPAVAYHEAGIGLRFTRAEDVGGAVWSGAVAIDSASFGGFSPSLAVVGDKPAICYVDPSGKDLKFAIANDTSGQTWASAVGVDVAGSIIGQPSLVDLGGQAAMSYCDEKDAGSPDPVLRYVGVPLAPGWVAQTGYGMGMQFHYTMREGFFFPGVVSQPAPGAILPYLRPLDGGIPQGDPVTGTPLTVRYRPAWPAAVAELRIGETLTLPKFGLPQVRGQSSAEVLYQQSIATDGTSRPSVTLHDPTRAKMASLSSQGLDAIPESIATTTYQGRVYFQRLAPHLQQRVYATQGANPQLVFLGEFIDEIAGEDYLNLNVLSVGDVEALEGLVEAGSGDKAAWDAAIDALSTAVETFIEDPAKAGTYKVGSSVPVNGESLAEISDSDTAVDSYALTATGDAAGYVSLLFGDGEAFTPQGDPVSIAVVKVVPKLYTGDMKVQFSSNPLDEQVGLRHSGDFAARPQDYEFEWRYASGGTIPPVYEFGAPVAVLGNSTAWTQVQNPDGALPSAEEYGAASSVSLPRSLQVYTPGEYQLSIVGEASSPADLEDTGQSTVILALIGAKLHIRIFDEDGIKAIDKSEPDLISGDDLDVLKTLVSEDPVPDPDDLSAADRALVVNRARIVSSHTQPEEGWGEFPGVVLKSDTEVDFSAGLPGEVIFSADLSSDLDGLVLYVNGIAALGFRAPAPFENTDPATGLSASGLPNQFRISTNYFTKGLNTIEVALFSAADPLFTSSVDFRLETITKQDRVDPSVYPSSPWQQPSGTLLNQITIGGSPSAPLGAPLLIMQDNAFTVRYRPLLSSGGLLTEGKATQDDVEWSDWMEPKLIPGWVKRVLDAINPYNQRMTDLFNNAVNTDVSVLTQAGTRWEGDIALNLDNVNEAGLIEIYETVLNRAKLFSIENGYDDPGVNNALLLAAGYLNDLYVILGNEAYADAANPTISLDDQDTVTEVSTSRFSFEGQVASVLEEELALLRGRDDLLNTSVGIAPAYNRLYWNYTNGIEAGEVIYAVNYNIKEKVGSSTENGIIDAADAQRMFPQSHGDAYGHYLTALKGYYQLLTNDNFTWTPRSETVLVLGQNVEIDYFDERKFAGAAADLARSAEQVLALTCRQSYRDDRGGGWGHFRDDLTNSQTGANRHWGVDEWASRTTQGAYFHWVNGNAMLPDEDLDPEHTGIRKVDRTTVPELGLLAATAESFQTTLDNANAFLNPLGLSPDAIAFDISSAELLDGHSHFEQIYERALGAVLNTKGSFDQAGRMTRLLRNQDNQIDEFNTAIEDEERAFNYRLIDLYGSPYSGDIGPGKTYAQGYDGPDLVNWFVVDRPTDLVDTSEPLSVEVRVPVEIEPTPSLLDVFRETDGGELTSTRTIELSPSPFVQFPRQRFGSEANPGQRPVTGRLQQALTDTQLAYMAVREINESLKDEYADFDRKARLFRDLLQYQINVTELREDTRDRQAVLTAVQASLTAYSAILRALADTQSGLAETTAESFPRVAGFSNDVTSGLRGVTLAVSTVAGKILKGTAIAADVAASGVGALRDREAYNLLIEVEHLGFNLEEQQAAFELIAQFQVMEDRYAEAARLALQLQKAAEAARTLIAQGDRIQLEREIFRRRAAAVVQGYRTRDVAFRTFRNEALEQYRTLFDLAARYTYLAAKSYDYETGLLGTPQGQDVFNRIVASRALGDLTGGVPQASVSTLGDAGLAGTMAQLQADFAVAEGRLGINNPDQNGTLFSLRHELFRLLDDPTLTADDEAWQQTLEQHIVSDLMADPDAATYCMNLRKPDGSRVPGIVIPFSTSIQHGHNWFGLPLAGGDHNFSPSSFATKIWAAGMVLEGYVGMDRFATGVLEAGDPDTNDPDALAATPYLYLIPCGTDSMRAPAFGDTDVIRSWNVADQALPLPYNLGATAFNDTQFFDANGTLTEQPWVLRKHQAIRPVDDPAYFYSWIPQDFVSNRLVGRSVWNSRWKIVIPAYSLLNDEEEGLERFVRSVDDIKIFLRTYSNSGN